MIALIDYDAGNTCSVLNALDRLGVDYVLTDDEGKIRKADKVIFPGVGHAGAAMDALKKKSLDGVIKELRQPVLGICVGMQLLGAYSEEGDTSCLEIIPAKVLKFDRELAIKVPHMGWNKVALKRDEELFRDIEDQSYFYFVHSYFMTDTEYAIGSCDYGLPFTAAVRRDNFWGIQFHAEKSGDTGEKLIQNFLENC